MLILGALALLLYGAIGGFIAKKVVFNTAGWLTGFWDIALVSLVTVISFIFWPVLIFSLGFCKAYEIAEDN